MNIRQSFQTGRLTVYLSGELDHHEARETLRALDELLDEYLPRECALDLSGLSFMDSSGIALMIRVGRRMKELGGRVWLENVHGQPQRVIEVSGIERILPTITGKQSSL